MRIFNREHDDGHALFSILQEMRLHEDAATRALACNLSHDCRVSQQREQAFLRYMGAVTDAAEFREKWTDYIGEKIKYTENPDFSAAHNSSNEAAKPQEKLLCIFLVNGLIRMFLWARSLAPGALPNDLMQLAEIFRTFPNTDDLFHEESKRFVDRFMKDVVKRKQFVDIIFKLYEKYRIANPYHPMWVAELSNFKAIFPLKDGDRLCHLIGVSTEKKKEMWIIALKFDSAKIGVLYSPTVIDGDSPLFFPTPEGYGTQSGLAVDLERAAQDPACEYIMRFPSLQIAEVDHMEGCAQLQETAEGPLQAIRAYHIGLLRKGTTKAEASAWIDRIDDCLGKSPTGENPA